jgi:hypothetical protein
LRERGEAKLAEFRLTKKKKNFSEAKRLSSRLQRMVIGSCKPPSRQAAK